MIFLYDISRFSFFLRSGESNSEDELEDINENTRLLRGRQKRKII